MKDIGESEKSWSDNDLIELSDLITKAGFSFIEGDSIKLLPYFRDFINNIILIKTKYGIDIVDVLSKFDDSSHLEKYIASAALVNKFSNDDQDDHFKINHILFKIIKQNFISIYSLLSYQFSYLTIDDLKSSYEASAKCQVDLKKSPNHFVNKAEKLAWFINLKNPFIYWNNENVKKHYSATINNFYKNSSVDLRRMHIFYDDYFHNSPLNLKQIKIAFQGLLFEQLIGINNRLIIIKDFESIKKYLYFENIDEINNIDNLTHTLIQDELKFKNIFFLDFALYQYPSVHKPNNYTDYNYHLLPANFGLEAPIKSEEDITTLSKKYEGESIFEFHGPYLFHIFKNNFQSFWNKERFIKTMDELIMHRVWRLLKSKNGKKIIRGIINDRHFVKNIKDHLNLTKKYISNFIDDLSINHPIFAETIQTNEENLMKSILDTFSSNDVENSLKHNFDISKFDLPFIELIIKELKTFSSEYNPLIKHILSKNFIEIAQIRDYLFQTFITELIYFNKDSKELFNEEAGFIQLVFQFYPNCTEKLFNYNDHKISSLEVEIYKIRSILYNYIEVIDFFTFWKRIIADQNLPFNNADDLLDNMFFDSDDGISSYLSILGGIKRIDYSVETNLDELKLEIIKDCQRFYDVVLKTSDKKNEIYPAFREMFREFIIRKINI
ncbi:MAG: hypothetical protein Q8N88_01185 [Nanoarchaeota archaeon]|nr:hypothetical protein [Nanoarchaeota archaeon]